MGRLGTAADVGLIGGVLVGGYLFYKNFPAIAAWIQDVLLGGIGGIGGGLKEGYNWLFGAGQVQKGMWTTSHDARKQGEHISIIAEGMVPNATFVYGWKELGHQQTFTTSASGAMPGGYLDITIAETTPPAEYTIYLDQRMSGGGYGERKFTVLPKDNPTPTTYNSITLTADDKSIAQGQTFVFKVQTYYYQTPAPISGVNVGLYYMSGANGGEPHQIATGTTDAAGRKTFNINTKYWNVGGHTLQAAVLPFHSDVNLQDIEIVQVYAP